MQNEDLYEEMVAIVKNLSRKKDFLDSLQIGIDETDFEHYVKLFVYPQDLQAALEAKAEALAKEQIVISLRIKEHIAKVKNEIKSFGKRFDKF